jgi:hypothetical protein
MPSQQTQPTVIVPITSAWSSKINWTQAVAIIASLLTFFSGGSFGLTDAQQAAIVVTIGVIQGIATWIMKTFFTSTVHASSLPD